MKDRLNKLPDDIQELIRHASDTARRHTVPVYLVGGFVRDLILGKPNYDLDIVVEGDGLAYAEVLASALKAKLISHRRFGTATIYAPGRHKIDIATARKEIYPKPGHLPEVTPGMLKEDLFRRDFTINSMAIDIAPDCFGALIDFFNGRRDLAAGLVRILHEVSFLDDPTRILRAVRFEQRYGFKIEGLTMKCLKEAVKLDMLGRVEPQRVRDDLFLILKEPDPVKPLMRLEKLAGLRFIHPRLRMAKETAVLMRNAARQIAWFNKVYEHRRKIDEWLVYFIALLDGIDEQSAQEVRKKLVLRRGEDLRIASFKKISYTVIQSFSRNGVRPARIFSFFEPLSYEVILLLRAKYKNVLFARHTEDFFEIYNGMRLLSSGHDVHNLGLAPGPAYQKIFSRVLRARVNGTIKTHEEELALIRKLVKISTPA